MLQCNVTDTHESFSTFLMFLLFCFNSFWLDLSVPLIKIFKFHYASGNLVIFNSRGPWVFLLIFWVFFLFWICSISTLLGLDVLFLIIFELLCILSRLEMEFNKIPTVFIQIKKKKIPTAFLKDLRMLLPSPS